MDPMLLLGGAKLLGGLFSARQDRKFQADAPRRNLMSQAQGARQAAEAYGFNPLTMLQYGQTGAGMGGAPLASAEMITSGLSDVADVVSGEADLRRHSAELQNDLLRVQIDQLRGAVARPSAASAVGSGASSLGGRSLETFGSQVWDWLSQPGQGANWSSPSPESWAGRFNSWTAPYIEGAHDTLFGWMQQPMVPDAPSEIHDLSPYEAPMAQAVSPAEAQARSVMDAFPPGRPQARAGRPYNSSQDEYTGRAYGFGLPLGFFRN